MQPRWLRLTDHRPASLVLALSTWLDCQAPQGRPDRHRPGRRGDRHRDWPAGILLLDVALGEKAAGSSDLAPPGRVQAVDLEGLTADHVRHGRIALEPGGPDRFTASEWFMAEVHLLRDPTHGISGMTMGGDRAKGVRFDRRFAANPVSATTTWRATTGNDASDANPGTAQQPVQSVAKAVPLAKPGDVIVFAPRPSVANSAPKAEVHHRLFSSWIATTQQFQTELWNRVTNRLRSPEDGVTSQPASATANRPKMDQFFRGEDNG